jgi:hypothetical protein
MTIHTTIAKLAKQFNVSASSIKRAKTVLRDGTEEQIDAIRAGKKTATGACKEIQAMKTSRKGDGKVA